MICSLDTLLTLSTSFWIFLNFGTTKIRAIVATITNAQIATHVAIDRNGSLSKIFINAHVAKIGAFTKIWIDWTIADCTCTTSFVSLVISDAIEKFLIFSMEKLCTFSYILDLNLAEKFAAILEEQNTKTIEIKTLMRVMDSIQIHCWRISWTWVHCVWISSVIFHIYSGNLKSIHTWATIKTIQISINQISFLESSFNILIILEFFVFA